MSASRSTPPGATGRPPASVRRVAWLATLLTLGAVVSACSDDGGGVDEAWVPGPQEPHAAWSACEVGYVIDASDLDQAGLTPAQVTHQVALLTQALKTVPGYRLLDGGTDTFVIGQDGSDDPLLTPLDVVQDGSGEDYLPAGIAIKFGAVASAGSLAPGGHVTGGAIPTLVNGRIASADILLDTASVAESAGRSPDRPLRLYRHVVGHAFGMPDLMDGSVMDPGKSGLDDAPGGLEGVAMTARRAGCE